MDAEQTARKIADHEMQRQEQEAAFFGHGLAIGGIGDVAFGAEGRQDVTRQRAHLEIIRSIIFNADKLGDRDLRKTAVEMIQVYDGPGA